MVVALFGLEYIAGAFFHDLKPFLGIDPREMSGIVAVAGNAVLFTWLLHFKRMSYASLFHGSPVSVKATIGGLAIPILCLIPALDLGMWTIEMVLETLFPLSAQEAVRFERAMSDGAVSGITVCILAPLLEEMLFRGIILRSFLCQYSRWTAIIGSALVFGLAHLNIYQFAVGVVLGTLSGWLYEQTRSLWPSILLHAAYNSSLWLLTFAPDLGEHGQPPLVSWVGSFALASFGTFWLQRSFLLHRAPSEPLS